MRSRGQDDSIPIAVETVPDGRRVALYSHDGEGLGHFRRNLLISRALLGCCEGLSTLLITGLREASAYEIPRGVDTLILPSAGKSSMGGYVPRSMRISMRSLSRLRASAIRGALEAFRPDLFLVDKLPLGMLDELVPALEVLQGLGTRIVLGLRDILDRPDAARREWAARGCDEAIARFYDAIWVYGDPRLYDPAREYEFSAGVRSKIVYTGYLNPRDVTGSGRSASRLRELSLPDGSLSLCVLGGGRDGFRVAETFLRAPEVEGRARVVLTGPLLSRDRRLRLESLCGGRDDTRIVDFLDDPIPLICAADRIVSMGGYNSICEILAFQKRALIVPRTHPRQEQLIRCERLCARGLIDMLHPAEMTADRMAAWLNGPARGIPAASSVLDFRGVERLRALACEVLGVANDERAVVHVRA